MRPAAELSVAGLTIRSWDDNLAPQPSSAEEKMANEINGTTVRRHDI